MERCLIEKRVNEIEYGIRQMLDKYWLIREKLNKTNAYTDSETRERMELLKEKDFLQKYLKMIGIQDFEIKSEWLVFKVI